MALACSYWVLFFLFYLVLFTCQSDCSKCDDAPFSCGVLGTLKHPFSNNSDLECGLFKVNCTSSHPTVLFGVGGHWLEVYNKISENELQVRDLLLDSVLHKKSCISFQNLSQPSSSFAITYSPNISILSCIKEPLLPNGESIGAYFGGGYKTYSCDGIHHYYSEHRSNSSNAYSKESTIPEGCSMTIMPVKDNYQNWDDPVEFLAPMFKLVWSVPEDHKGEDKWKKVVLVSAISAGVALFGLCFVIGFFLIYRCKKKTNGTYLLSRNISSVPTSKSDLEGGRFYFRVPIFSYQELKEATNNFDSSRELGDGGFGTVYYGKLHNGREVAIKRLHEHNCRRVEQFMNEINILACLRHPNLVSLYGCTSRRSRELLLVYEYIPNGTVADHLYNKGENRSPLTWSIRLSIAIETASALAYLHRSDIIHRDVKTNNILLDKNFCVKVADFGLSRLFPNDVSHISTTPQGTPGYVDPEYHQCYQLTNKSDVYSFGVVLIELISSMPAVDLTRHRHEINLANLALDRIQRCAFDELIDSSLGYQTDAEVKRMTTSVAELAFRCLQLEKDLRPSMDEILAFLQDIQAGEDCNMETPKESKGNYSLPAKIITSPETDDSVLLKRDAQSSPAIVIET